MSDEVSIFIRDCAKKGINTPEAIADAARSRIGAIDEVIFQADKLRPEKQTMQSVIRTFGFELPKPSRKPTPLISEDTTQENLSPKALDLILKICEILGEKGSASNREIMNHCGITIEKDFEAYAALKWLSRNGIATRSKDSNNYTKGSQWDFRPKQA